MTKLKSLLARMHQSSQRAQVDSVSARKGHMEATEELRLRVDKEEAENRALAQQLRCLSFESAFHSDVELAIERAAQSIASQVGVWLDEACVCDSGGLYRSLSLCEWLLLTLPACALSGLLRFTGLS